ncbi:MAG: alpha/beta family hydrolase [Microthrixaceae bacterium]
MARRRPKDPAALVLWPGAGTGADHPSLLAIRDAITEMPVEPVDFPYRREGRKAPDRAPKLIASIVDEVARIAEGLGVETSRLVIGGRSMGGRMCSMAAAEGLEVAGVVLIAYPLHPPTKPDKLRTEHLGDLRVPSLWLCGDRDPFGTPEEIGDAQSLVKGPVTSVTLKGRHDLKGTDAEVIAEIRDWLGLGRRHPPARPRSR